MLLKLKKIAFPRGKETILCILIGPLSALLVHIFFYVKGYSLYYVLKACTFDVAIENPLLTLLIIPIGLLVSLSIVLAFAHEKSTGCGTHFVLKMYHLKGGIASIRDTILRVISAAITMSTGGSAGLEGPSLSLGSGVASWIGSRFTISPSSLKLLFLSGAAAGLTAIFKAPLTGTLFALEIPYKRDLEGDVLIPASLASLTSYITIVYLEKPEMLFPLIAGEFHMLTFKEVIYSILLGIVIAGASIVFIRLFKLMEHITRVKIKDVRKRLALAIIGGLLLALIGLINLRLTGRMDVLGIGYDIIEKSTKLKGEELNLGVEVLVILVILKMVATCITLNFGGSGGLFIPSIVVGSLIGVTFVNALHITEFQQILIVASMAAMLAATHKAYMTSIAFVAETCGPATVLPSIVSSAIAYLITYRDTFYELQLPVKEMEKRLALERIYSEIIEEGKDYILDTVKAKDVMVENPIKIHEDETYSKFIEYTHKYKHRVLPVVDNENKVIGVLKLEDVTLVERKMWSMKVKYAPMYPALTVLEDETLRNVVKLMIEYGEDHVYVVDTKGRLIGVISDFDAAEYMLNLL